MNREFRLLFEEFHMLLDVIDQYAQNPNSRNAKDLLKSVPLRYSFSEGQKVKLRRDFRQFELIAREGDEVVITRIVDADKPYSVWHEEFGGLWVYPWEII